MSYELAEREAIMAESGVLNIAAAFADTERWKIKQEASHAVEFYSLAERREFLDEVERWRGKVGRMCMEKAMTQEWNARKAA